MSKIKKIPLLKLGHLVGVQNAEKFFSGDRKTILVKFEVLNGHKFTKDEIMSIVASGLGVWANEVTAAVTALQVPPTPPAIQGNSADVAALQALGIVVKVPLPAINPDGTVPVPTPIPAA